MEKTKKPAIRFDGFCSEWTKYEIRDFIEDYTEKTTVQNQYPVLTSSQQQGIVFQEEYFADRQVTTSENVGYFILPFGFFTYRSRSDNSVFVFNRNDIIDRGIISYYYPVFHPNNIDSNFLLRRLNVGTAKQIVKIVEGTGQKVLNHDKFKKLSISVPDEKECAKIGSFFETIDQQITLAQQKYDKLLTFKKSMLEKMFPQNGAKVPEVRFAGFAEDWELRKCGDVMDESREIGHKGDKAKKITVKLWGKGVYVKNEDGSKNTQYYIRHKGQFIYSKLDFLNSAFGVVPEELENYETTADVPAFDCNEINPYFMYYIAIQKNFYLKNGIIADGSRKAKRIHADTFLEMPLMVPTIEEQNKIVEYLQSFDNLITLYQQELEKLKNIKSALLEKMFV